jgi:hypothetical protein
MVLQAKPAGQIVMKDKAARGQIDRSVREFWRSANDMA